MDGITAGDRENVELERAILEQRLAEQDIFRQVLQDVRKKYRRLLFWTATSIGTVSIIWIFLGCPILHKIRLCPWAG